MTKAKPTTPETAPITFHGTAAPWHERSWEGSAVAALGTGRIVPGDTGAILECIKFIAHEADLGYEEVMGTLDEFGDRLRAIEAYGPMLLRIAASEAFDGSVPRRLTRLEELLRTHAWYVAEGLGGVEPSGNGLDVPDELSRPRGEVIPGVDELLEEAYPTPSPKGVAVTEPATLAEAIAKAEALIVRASSELTAAAEAVAKVSLAPARA